MMSTWITSSSEDTIRKLLVRPPAPKGRSASEARSLCAKDLQLRQKLSRKHKKRWLRQLFVEVHSKARRPMFNALETMISVKLEPGWNAQKVFPSSSIDGMVMNGMRRRCSR